jgi:uncharacterized peroxidase-related enzyme
LSFAVSGGTPPFMPHIALPEGVPGIRSALQFRPETAAPLLHLAEVLLRGPNTLTSAEREMIAAFVSSKNECRFCYASHRAAAAHHLGGDYSVVDAVRADYRGAPVSAKLKALLAIAGQVQQGGTRVTAEHVDRATDIGDSRHGPDRRRVLHVQPLRRWSGDIHSGRRACLRRNGPAHGESGALMLFLPRYRTILVLERAL